MNTQQMKIDALQIALKSEDQRGLVHVENFNKSWKLQCACYKLTRFGFSLYVRNFNDWRCCFSEMTEREAQLFLYGMGNEAS